MKPAYQSKDEYAISTYMFEHEPLDHALEAIVRQGFAHVELWGDTVHLDPRVMPDTSLIGLRLQNLRLHAHAFHTPFRNFPAFADEQEGRRWRERLWKQSLDIASELRIPIAVIHAMNRHEYNYGYDQLGYLKDLLAELSQYANRRGVKLALENIPSGESPSGEILCTLVEQIKLFGEIPELYWCLDIGHVTITCNDMRGEIDACIDRLVSLHIHNNDGLHDIHDLPDRGVIDWPCWYDYLREKGYAGQFVMELACGADPFDRLGVLSDLFSEGRGK